MALRAETKTTFEAAHVIQPIYTGGSVGLSSDGHILATSLGEDVILSNLASGQHLAKIEGDGDTITTLALSPDASFIAICSRTLSMRIFALTHSDGYSSLDVQLVRSLKPHTGPVVTITIDSTSTLLATGAADGSIKIWDIRGGFTTHTFHGHSGIVSALHFFQISDDTSGAEAKDQKRKTKGSNNEKDVDMLVNQSEMTIGYRLASGGEDGRIRIWDLHKRKSLATLDSHVSVVRSLDYSQSNHILLSASRDRTVIVWSSRTWKSTTTVPVLESVESVGFVENDEYFFIGGESGMLRIFSLQGKEITQEQKAAPESEAIVNTITFDELSFILTIHADQALKLHSLASLAGKHASNSVAPLPIIKRISGSHDEVIDLAYVGMDNSLMALATNSEDIRLVSMIAETSEDDFASKTFGSEVALLRGHTDVIITIDTDWSGRWLATGAKDNTARLWRLDPATSSFECYATFTGHAESINAVALPNLIPAEGSKARSDPLNHPPAFMITGSQDRTIKKWDIAANRSATSTGSKAAYTRKAHDKDMNAIDISHSSTMFASASQDRTVKIWDVETGESIGVLRGHKRGVWSVAFSPSDMPTISSDSGTMSGNRGMAVTGGGDKTVRIWSLNDFSCLKTFEGHTNTVLKVLWLPFEKDKAKSGSTKGPQVASAASDGLVKVWNGQSGECDATLDNHTDRVWALVVRPSFREPQTADELTLELASGSADSTITFWHDTTSKTAHESVKQASARIEQDQELQNYMQANNYREAIVLALQLNHPRRLLELFTKVMDSSDKDETSLSGKIGVDQVLGSLGDEQLWKLLIRIRDWNTNARTARVAQHIMNCLFRSYPKDKFINLQKRRLLIKVDNDEDDAEAAEDAPRNKRSGENIRDVLNGLKAYTDKHYARLEKIAEERCVLMWTLQMMET